jgi:hypothetical protein
MMQSCPAKGLPRWVAPGPLGRLVDSSIDVSNGEGLYEVNNGVRELIVLM